MNDTPQMMTNMTAAQEAIERDVRVTIGDLHVQLIVARNRIAELEAIIAALQPKDSDIEAGTKPNSKRGETRPPTQ